MPHRVLKRKILMVLESVYPTSGGGGAENQVRTISRYLRERGVDVLIITPMTPESPQVEHDSVDGVPVWRIPYPQVRFVGGLVMLWRLARYLVARRREYDVIHAHIAHNMACVSSALGRLLGKTVIVKLTGWLELKHGVLALGRHPFMAVKRTALRMANYVQATSTQIRARLLERGFRKSQVLVIPNAVDIRRFAVERRDAHARSEEALVFVFVGRLVPEKGLDTLLDAWEAAFAPGDNVRLQLIGRGDLHEQFAERIRKSGREQQVELLGPRSNVENFLVNADVGVLPSLYEGLSNTLLEYMAAGLPVLGTRVSGTEDFVETGRTGWLIESQDVAAMTERLREIAATERDRLAAMGEAARQAVTARAGIDAILSQLGELYEIRVTFANTRTRECT